jgi:ATP-dependent DNA helicase RecG
LALLAENNALTLDDLAAMTGKHHATVARRIKSMKGVGMLDRVGSDKDGYWEIVG